MRSSRVSRDIDLLSEEIKRVQCARYGLMSLSESAYIVDPVMRPYALLEAKSIIRFGIRSGYYPKHYLNLLESNDVIALRLATTEAGDLAHKKLDESFGMDLALGIGQMIPGVKTFAGIAGVAYYAYQAYDSFNGGSTLGGVGNLFLTLLSAAAIEPLGATAFVGPIVTALGPLTKLGQAFESFLGLIIKGAFGPVAKLLMKNKALAAFIEWVGKAGLPALEQAGGWLSKNTASLAEWLAKKGAAKAAAGTAEGQLGTVAGFLSKKVGTAAEMMSKFITNLKTFITTAGKQGFSTAAGAEAKAAGAEAGAAAAAAEPLTQTAGALKNLGSAAMADLRAFNSFLDAQAGKLVSKVEAMQTKQALNALRGADPIIYTDKAGKEAARIWMDAEGKIFRQVPGKSATRATPSELMKTKRWSQILLNQGISPARAQQISRGLIRGLSAGAGEVPNAEAAAGL